MTDDSAFRFRWNMARGSAWMVALRWGVRAIGLVSTIILARLLAPSDFGVVAMAMLVAGLVEVFAQTGQQLHLIRHGELDRSHYDTAWTVTVIQGALLGGVLLAVAPLCGRFFGEPRAVPVVSFLALRPFIQGLENIGVVAFRKELDFAKEFRYRIYQKLGSFTVTVTLAFLLRSYWALAIGIVTQALLAVTLSYRMHAFRPRFSLEHLRDLVGFSSWMLVLHIAHFLNERTGETVVGRAAGAASMGRFHVGSDVGAAPTAELAIPMARTLFPLYSKLLGQPQKLRAAYLDVLTTIGILACSTAVGVALVSNDFVALVLGPKWAGVGRLAAWVALASAAAAIGNTVFGLLNVTGLPRASAKLAWLRFALLAPTLYFAQARHGVVGVAIGMLIVNAVMIPIMFFGLSRHVPLGAGDFVASLWRPLVASTAMTATVTGVYAFNIPILVPRLVLAVLVGGATFSITMILLWRVSGRPDGMERALIERVQRLWARLRRAPD